MSATRDRELAALTWVEARERFGEGLVAILPVGSTEPHGPHLALDVDVTIALAQSHRAAELLAAAGVRALVLPPIAYGVTHFTAGFEGGITLRPGTLWALLEDVVSSLEEQGVRRIVFSNGHLEPAHVAVLRGVALDHPPAAQLARDGEPALPPRRPGKHELRAEVVFADNTRRRWAETLSEAFRRGDHAGRYETGIVLAADPASVREAERASLPPVEIDLVGKIRGGARSFREAGADRAYCGDPAAADAAEGREQVERLAEMIALSVREAWPELFDAADPAGSPSA